jgi:hypothetical protein
MRKIIVAAALAGILIALAMGICSFYMFSNGFIGPAAVRFAKIVPWVWPTVIMMGPDAEGRAGTVLLVMSAIANGFVYALAAFCVGLVWENIFGARSPIQPCEN